MLQCPSKLRFKTNFYSATIFSQRSILVNNVSHRKRQLLYDYASNAIPEMSHKSVLLSKILSFKITFNSRSYIKWNVYVYFTLTV